MEIWSKEQADCPVSNWGGGSTTEFVCYPPEASYKERNFLFRVSSATVESGESDFTRLPGIWRILMVLEGDIRLEVPGTAGGELSPYEQYAFDGGLAVKSYGICRDLNLMMADGCDGRMQVLSFENGRQQVVGAGHTIDARQTSDAGQTMDALRTVGAGQTMAALQTVDARQTTDALRTVGAGQMTGGTRFAMLYAAEGDCTVRVQHKEYRIAEHGFLFVQDPEGEITAAGAADSKAVVVLVETT